MVHGGHEKLHRFNSVPSEDKKQQSDLAHYMGRDTTGLITHRPQPGGVGGVQAERWSVTVEEVRKVIWCLAREGLEGWRWGSLQWCETWSVACAGEQQAERCCTASSRKMATSDSVSQHSASGERQINRGFRRIQRLVTEVVWRHTLAWLYFF